MFLILVESEQEITLELWTLENLLVIKIIIRYSANSPNIF